jgi:hypothetical protein
MLCGIKKPTAVAVGRSDSLGSCDSHQYSPVFVDCSYSTGSLAQICHTNWNDGMKNKSWIMTLKYITKDHTIIIVINPKPKISIQSQSSKLLHDAFCGIYNLLFEGTFFLKEHFKITYLLESRMPATRQYIANT